MPEKLTITLSEIDPNEFKGTTVFAEPLRKPGRENVYILEEPVIVTPKGRRVSLLKVFGGPSSGRVLAVRWEIVLLGGEARGLRFPGLLEEADVRHYPENHIELREVIRPPRPHHYMFE